MTHVPWHPESIVRTEEVHGLDSVELVSVGIDIGTTTTQLMFSRLVARRAGSEYSSKFNIEEREIEYESPVRLTPYVDHRRVDAEAIDEYITEWYADAGYDPSDVDTGAVIITGEANRKENADRIIELFSEQSGRFVCATAGANLETLMAAHGSGAVDLSLESDQNVLHIDIGGGTTKLASIHGGFVQDTAAVNVGARLVAFGGDDTVSKVEHAALQVAEDLGIDITVGEQLSAADRRRLATRFAELLFEVIEGHPSELARSLLVTDPTDLDFGFDTLTFSGGGAEYVYDRDPGYYNDLGPEFGLAVRGVVENRGYNVDELDTGIRATAVGSNQHTVQVSGNTIMISDEDVLPIKNVPMVPFVVNHDDDPDELVQTFLEKLALYDADIFDHGFAFGFHLHGMPNYDFLSMVSNAAVTGWETMDGEHPLILAFDADVAMSAGRIAQQSVDAPVISIDGVELDQFGYLDIGEPLEETNAVPLTVKSLLFEG